MGQVGTMWDNALECLPRWKINTLHFKCVFMDCKWYLLLKSNNLAKTSACKFFLIVVFFYIQFNTALTYPNMGVSWDSWHFLLNNVLFSHTCISVFAHLPFLKQHIRAPLCKKNQVNMSLRIWTRTKILKGVPTYPTNISLSIPVYQEAPPLFLTLW